MRIAEFLDHSEHRFMTREEGIVEMRSILRSPWIRALFPAIVLAYVPGKATAGFEWIGWWHETSVGQAIYFIGSDQPDGVVGMGARIEVEGGFLGINPPMDLTFVSSIELSRPFSLSGSPGGWRIDLNWLTLESSRFTIHMNSSMPSSMHVKDLIDPAHIVDPSWSPSNRSIFLPDGDYQFQVSTAGVLSFPVPPPGFTFEIHTGHLRYEFRASLTATAVPEPASVAILCQGLAAAGCVIYATKRTGRIAVRTESDGSPAGT